MMVIARFGAHRPLATSAAGSLASSLALLAPALGAQEAPCDRDGWSAVIEAHAARHPLLGMDDLYKLLHQGAFGSEHAVDDVAGARAWLADEIRALAEASGRAAPESASAGPEVERVAPDGAVVRVHLRPFLARGGDPEALLEAFVTTANRQVGGADTFRCSAAVAADLGVGTWARADWEGFVDARARVGFPAMHHSRVFEAAYRPAYRVVAGDLVEGLAR